MAFNFFGFGRKRRTVRRKASAKPSKMLLKIAKRYGVKVKSGKKYKKTGVLKRQCAKRIRALIRKVKKGSRKSRFGAGRLRRSSRRSAPLMLLPPPAPRRSMLRRGIHKAYKYRGRYARRGAKGAALLGALLATKRYGGAYVRSRSSKDAKTSRQLFSDDMARARAGVMYPLNRTMGMMNRKKKSDFGKRRRTRRKSAAMFGRRRRVGRPRKVRRRTTRRRTTRRRYRFGNGGNPPLMASTGYEFCPGGGGVLGANSTGLFPSPCMGAPQPAPQFGKRRRRYRRM
jgi:hypothetical protein